MKTGMYPPLLLPSISCKERGKSSSFFTVSLPLIEERTNFTNPSTRINNLKLCKNMMAISWQFWLWSWRLTKRSFLQVKTWKLSQKFFITFWFSIMMYVFAQLIVMKTIAICISRYGLFSFSYIVARLVLVYIDD